MLQENCYYLTINQMNEFSETSYRAKRKGFSPTTEWPESSGEPGTHVVMAVFGCLVYLVNKCALALTPENVQECSKQIKVCATYFAKKGDFPSLLHGLPTESATIEAGEAKAISAAKQHTVDFGINWKDQVNKMSALEDFTAAIVTLVSNAKADKIDSSATHRCYSILNAFDNYKWGTFR